MTNYEGRGKYRHYKGGTYTALGIGEHETTGQRLVVYVSDSAEHTAERAKRGADFILRPLNAADGPDAWNTQAQTPEGACRARFYKLPDEEEGMMTEGGTVVIDLVWVCAILALIIAAVAGLYWVM